MKRIVSVIVAAATLILCFSLSACGNKYSSRYSATLMVRSNTSNEASVSFDSFSGTYVMQLKNKGDDAVFITNEAELGAGNIKVYYDCNDEKRELIEIGNDGIIKGKTENFTYNRTVYIIIESDGKCNEGSFSFVLNKAES